MLNTWNPAELNQKINQLEAAITTPEAEDIQYDNTTSGLTADDVQEAIDELNTDIGLIPVVKKTTKTGTTTAAGMLNISDMDPKNILAITAPSGTTAYCLWREQSTAGRTTVLVLDGSLQPITNTEITLNVTYI